MEDEQGGRQALSTPPTPEASAFASPQLGFFKSAKRRREPSLDSTPKVLE